MHAHTHTAEGFEVQLRVLQAGGVQILASLPSVIPGSFILVVTGLSTEMDKQPQVVMAAALQSTNSRSSHLVHGMYD